MSDKKKVTVVVNKAWEYDPFFNAITHPVLRPADLPDPSVINTVKEPMILPRAEMHLKYIDVAFRCVQNMMDPNVNKSNSEAKMVYMPSFLESDNADLIISVSTAESTPEIAHKLANDPEASINGSVIVGNRFFMSDQRAVEGPDPESRLDVVQYANYSNDTSDDFYTFLNNSSKRIVNKFIPAKNAPAPEMFFRAAKDFASVGVVNIVHYENYPTADKNSLEDFRNSKCYGCPASLETTHGIVSMAANSNKGKHVPVIFVSPITDRYLHFDDDVDDTQNYIAAFNAGIAVGEILVMLNDPKNWL